MSFEGERPLPPGWARTSLGDVTDVSGTKTEPSDARGVQYLGLEHIESKSGRILGTGRSDDIKSTKSVFRSGDVLYGKLRPYLNKVCIPDFDGICSTDILVFPQHGYLDNRYLRYVLADPALVEFANQNSKGINLPRVSYSKLGEYEFDLPPLNEQRRIVAKIEELTARSRRAREALEAVQPLLEQLRQSVLGAAFSGRLTADWREKNKDVEPASVLLDRIRAERRRRWEENELAMLRAKGKEPIDDRWKAKYKEPTPIDPTGLPELPEGWCWASIDQVVEADGGLRRGPFGSALKKSLFVPSGIRVFEQGNVINQDFSRGDYYITQEYFETKLSAFEILPGDVLVSCAGTIGRLAIVPEGVERGVINQALLRIRLQPDAILKGFFALVFGYIVSQAEFDDFKKGTALKNLVAVKELKAVPIPLPPEQEQLEIIRLAKHAEESIRSFVGQIDLCSENLKVVNQSILAKAFRGELVPQDPSDEPASVLLERIRAQRGAAGADTNKRRSSRPLRLRGQEENRKDAKTAKNFATDDDPLQTVLHFLQFNPGPHSKSDILNHTNLNPAAWQILAPQLANHPSIHRTGQKRATRYEWGR